MHRGRRRFPFPSCLEPFRVQTWSVEIAGEAELGRFGELLERLLPAPFCLALDGPLGAGKTRLVQAIARAAAVPEADVVSPTFTLLHEYSGNRRIFHLDAYRLRDADDLVELGWDEYCAAPALVLVEWAERIRAALPGERLHVRIVVTGETTRRLEFTAASAAAAAVLDALARLWPPAGCTG